MHFYKNKIPHDLSISKYKSPFLYFTHKQELRKVNILNNQETTLKKVDTQDLLSIEILEDGILLVYSDKMIFPNGDISYILVKKYSIVNDRLIVLNKKNELLSLTNNKNELLPANNHFIMIISEVNEFCFSLDLIWYIKDNRVYKKYNNNKPVLITNTFKDKIDSIEINNKNIFLLYKDKVEVYDLYDTLLVLKYTYKTNNYKVFNCNKLYLVDKDILVLEEYPKIIYKGIVENIYKDNEKDILINKDNIIINSDNKVNKKINIYNNGLIKDTFLNTKFTIDSEDEKSIYNKFEEQVLDKYRKLYYELKTKNDSLILKKDKLSDLYNKVKAKINEYEERKNEIERKLEEVNHKYEEILKRVGIKGENIYKYIEKVREGINRKRNSVDEKYVRLLKIQKDLLMKKVYLK